MIDELDDRLKRYETALRNLRVRREYLITDQLGTRIEHPWATGITALAENLVSVDKAISVVEKQIEVVKETALAYKRTPKVVNRGWDEQ